MRLGELRQRPAVNWVMRVVDGFLRHDDISLAAAVAFYTLFSFAPLVMLFTTVGKLVDGGERNDLVGFLDRQLRPRAGEVTEAVLKNARNGIEVGSWRGVLSVVLLVVSASAVFGQLQTSLNAIWEIRPESSGGVWRWLRKRLLSLGMVVTALFILLVSLVLSSVVEHVLPDMRGVGARAVSIAVSFIVSSSLFAAIFRILPDDDVSWSAICRGSVLTGALFTAGKAVLGLYLEHGGVAESYGKAAGAVILLLAWVYYSCIILFIGAEVTSGWIREGGGTHRRHDLRTSR